MTLEAIRPNNDELLNLRANSFEKRIIDEITAEDEGGALYWAAACGHLHFIEPLIRTGANVNKPNSLGRTPVYAAAYSGHAEIITALKAGGADVNTPDDSDTTPVCAAAYGGHAKAITALKAAGANVNTTEVNGLTPLYIAVQMGDLTVINALLEAGANANTRTPQGTPLELAKQNTTQKGQYIVRMLETHLQQYPNGIKVLAATKSTQSHQTSGQETCAVQIHQYDSDSSDTQQRVEPSVANFSEKAQAVTGYYESNDILFLRDALLNKAGLELDADNSILKEGCRTYLVSPFCGADGLAALNGLKETICIALLNTEKTKQILCPYRMTVFEHWITICILVVENTIHFKLHDSFNLYHSEEIETALQDFFQQQKEFSDFIAQSNRIPKLTKIDVQQKLNSIFFDVQGVKKINFENQGRSDIYAIQADRGDTYCGGYTARLIVSLTLAPEQDIKKETVWNCGGNQDKNLREEDAQIITEYNRSKISVFGLRGNGSYYKNTSAHLEKDVEQKRKTQEALSQIESVLHKLDEKTLSDMYQIISGPTLNLEDGGNIKNILIDIYKKNKEKLSVNNPLSYFFDGQPAEIDANSKLDSGILFIELFKEFRDALVKKLGIKTRIEKLKNTFLKNPIISDGFENALNLPSQAEIQVFTKECGIPLIMPKFDAANHNESEKSQKQLEKKVEVENGEIPEVSGENFCLFKYVLGSTHQRNLDSSLIGCSVEPSLVLSVVMQNVVFGNESSQTTEKSADVLVKTPYGENANMQNVRVIPNGSSNTTRLNTQNQQKSIIAKLKTIPSKTSHIFILSSVFLGIAWLFYRFYGNSVEPVCVAVRNGNAEAINNTINVDTLCDGQTPICVAAYYGHAETIVALKTAGADVKMLCDENTTPVYVAARRGHAKAIVALHKAGASVNTPAKGGFTPVYIAAQEGHAEVITELYAAGANVSTPAKNGFTPLYAAAQGGHAKAIVALHKAGATNVNTPAKNGFTPVYVAALGGHAEAITALHAGGANVSTPDTNGWAPVCIAAYYGRSEAITALHAAGANVDTPAPDGRTPVYIAAYYNHAKAIDALHAGGANVDTPALDGRTPVYIAAYYGHSEAITALHAGGANMSTPNKNGWTPVYIAAYYNHAKAIDALHAGGANMSTPDKDGWTPACIAAYYGHSEAITALHAGGANMSTPNKDGWTPVYIAAYYNHAKAIAALHAGGANVDTPAPDGRTPLYIAACYDYSEVVKALLEAGADVSIRAPLETALESDKVAKVLEAQFSAIKSESGNQTRQDVKKSR